MALYLRSLLKFNVGFNARWRNRGSSRAMSSVQCKVALISGGSVGIGLGFAKALLAAGARGVMLGDIREDEGNKAVCELNQQYGKNKAFFLKTDVTCKEELEALFKATMERYKQLDIVINNAGILQDKNWDKEIDINVKGVVHGTLLGFKYMGRHFDRMGGSIVNVASILGLQPFVGCPVYTGTKHFIIGFSRSMSHNHYECLTGVKIYSICPGVTATAMVDEAEFHALECLGDVGKILKDGLGALPPQTVDDCGCCVVKILCSGENGSVWVIEGGECYKVNFPDRRTLRCD